jgi:hypothetical protein
MKVSEFIEWLKTQPQEAIVKVHDSCDEGFIPFTHGVWQHCLYRKGGILYLDIGDD